MRDLLPFVPFKKREKHPWSTTFSKIGKSNTTPWVPNKMNKCIYGINGTKSSNAPKILFPKRNSSLNNIVPNTKLYIKAM